MREEDRQKELSPRQEVKHAKRKQNYKMSFDLDNPSSDEERYKSYSLNFVP